MTDITELDEFSIFTLIHENKQNKLVLKVFLWLSLSIPIFSIGIVLNIFPFLTYYNTALIVCLIFLTLYLFTIIFYKIFPYSHLTKYFLLFSVTFTIFMLSINKGFSIDISYILVPTISLLYLNRKFTIKTIVFSYFVMAASIVIKIHNSDFPYNELQHKFLQVFIGRTLEYFFITLLISIIAKKNYLTINSNFKAIKLQMDTQKSLISSYVALLCKKQTHLKNHLFNCSGYTKNICDYFRQNKKYKNIFTPITCYNIITSSLLHDIGLISIPDKILEKDKPLTKSEFTVLKTHTTIGKQLVEKNMKSMQPDFYKTAIDIVLYHHEQWNGNGYPFGLEKEEIPFSARIVYAANQIDNILTKYVNSGKLSYNEAINLILQMSDHEIDPVICQAILESKNKIYKNYLKSFVEDKR